MIRPKLYELASIVRRMHCDRFVLLTFLIMINICCDCRLTYAAEYLPPGAAPPEGRPPAPGSGPFPASLIQGDIDRPNPPTGTADRTNGSRFPVRPETAPTFDRLSIDRGDGRGRRNIDTRRAAGAAGTNRPVNDEDLVNFQNQDYPYPTGVAAGRPQRRLRSDPFQGGYQNYFVNSRMVVNDNGPLFGRRYSPAPRWLDYEAENFPLPSVKPFCKILVILGVVFATVYMVFAAYSVVLGHKDAGSRVTGAAGGLILLLMAYSIYKVVMINALRIPWTGGVDTIESLEAHPRQPLQSANTPIVPAAPAANRSNMPVRPFFNAQNP